ncbi:MAG: GrpB family protein [Methylocystaceae bacterium]|nr:MAG: GrpB family protein [Methylocystaceae bacterium]
MGRQRTASGQAVGGAMSKSANKDASRLQGLDAAAHRSFRSWSERREPMASFDLDEPITLLAADPRWPARFQEEAARLRRLLPSDLAPEIQHIGSTAVPGLDSKPVIDLMVGLGEPARIAEIVAYLEQLGYESFGEAGVPGRWALRRRDGSQHYNIAVIAFDGERWRLNLAIRDFLRANAEAARTYALAKWRIVDGGADTLLAYSDAKQAIIETIAEQARHFKK